MPDCCTAWDNNTVVGGTHLMVARLDGYPLTSGHTLIIPRRHVTSFTELSADEVAHAYALIKQVCDDSAATSFTIGVNDGEAAGRTIPHLHIHVIPRRRGDVPDPRGGIRRVLVPNADDDAWIRSKETSNGIG
jgi:diadenosine tetraphosphate (Ap4A) HIT family hydrolase